MLDTNIIISAILFPKSIITEIVKHVIINHKIVLSQYSITEINEVFDRKFPHRVNEMEIFMKKLPYELFTTKEIGNKKYPKIRDIDDIPILANAIESYVDLLITGDKDFSEVIIKRPKIMNPREYVNEYMDNSRQTSV